jgi:hypothetical protein
MRGACPDATRAAFCADDKAEDGDVAASDSGSSAVDLVRWFSPFRFLATSGARGDTDSSGGHAAMPRGSTASTRPDGQSIYQGGDDVAVYSRATSAVGLAQSLASTAHGTHTSGECDTVVMAPLTDRRVSARLGLPCVHGESGAARAHLLATIRRELWTVPHVPDGCEWVQAGASLETATRLLGTVVVVSSTGSAQSCSLATSRNCAHHLVRSLYLFSTRFLRWVASFSLLSLYLLDAIFAHFFLCLFRSLLLTLACLTFLARFLRCHHWPIQPSSRTFHSPCMCSAMAGANVLPHASDISGRGYDRLRASRGETKRCARATRKRSEHFIFILSLFFSCEICSDNTDNHRDEEPPQPRPPKSPPPPHSPHSHTRTHTRMHSLTRTLTNTLTCNTCAPDTTLRFALCVSATRHWSDALTQWRLIGK